MNADTKRQIMNNSGAQLFDLAGPTSLGQLPQGEIKPRIDSIIITSPIMPGDAHPFAIGSAPKTPLLPDRWMRRGNEELKKQNLIAKRDQGSTGRFGTREDGELTAPEIKVKVANVPKNFAGSGGQVE